MKFLAILCLLILASCENPYPEAGEFNKNPRREQRDPGADISAVLPSNIEFREGIESGEKFKITAGNGGIAKAKIEGDLPYGAHFDEKTFILTWRPSYFAGNDPKDPTVKKRIYPIKIYFWNSRRNDDRRDKDINLVVYDVPRSLDIDGRNSTSVTEGNELVYDFSIENEDYPTGPFNVFTDNFPANTKVEKIDENNFKIRFSPDFHHVRANTDGYSLDYEGSITVSNPANHKSTKTVSINVKDRRLAPKLVAPKPSEGGLNISFQVSSFDLNGETSPKIEMRSKRPEIGEFKTELIEDKINHRSVLKVDWKDIPPSYNGRSFTFDFKSCEYRSSYCSTESTKVEIKVKERKAPKIIRKDWKVGTIKYLNFDQKEFSTVLVEDGDGLSSVSSVEVFPKSMQKYVTWKNGNLFMKFDQEGIYQFNILATSEYNLQSAESFVVEVFSKNRSKTLYFTDSTRDLEAKFFKEAFTKNGIELMNPELQVLNERNISGRETLVLGTSVLTDPALTSTIERAMKHVKNIIIASPLLEQMPKKFLDKLSIDYGISISGRFLDISESDKPEIKDMIINSPKQFTRPKDFVSLSERATNESDSPVIFSSGVETKACKDVFEISNKTKTKRYTFGIVCNRDEGGRLAILGTEFADIKTQSADSGLAHKWLGEMLTAKLTVIVIERGSK